MQRSTHLHTQESLKNTTLETITYTLTLFPTKQQQQKTSTNKTSVPSMRNLLSSGWLVYTD